MTGRDMIMYILKNHLEDEEIVKDGKLVGFLTVDEVAVLFDVGVETIKALIKLDKIKHVVIGDALYIPWNYYEN